MSLPGLGSVLKEVLDKLSVFMVVNLVDVVDVGGSRVETVGIGILNAERALAAVDPEVGQRSPGGDQ